MTRELILGASLLTCMAAPLATAEKLPPHSDYYDQHPHPNPNKPGNDVALLVYRAKRKADLYVSNFCLGTAKGPAGAPAYPNEALVRTARVKHHRISFAGKATVYTADGQSSVSLTFHATIGSSSVTGSAKLGGASCKSVSFTAKRTGHTA